jgi:hypothetical protein
MRDDGTEDNLISGETRKLAHARTTRRMKYAGFPLKALSVPTGPLSRFLTWVGNPSFISAMKNALE